MQKDLLSLYLGRDVIAVIVNQQVELMPRRNFSFIQYGFIIILFTTSVLLIREVSHRETNESSVLPPQPKRQKVLLPISPTMEDILQYCSWKCEDANLDEPLQPKALKTLNKPMCNLDSSMAFSLTCKNIKDYKLTKNGGRMNYFVAKYLPCNDLKDTISSWGRCAIVGSSGSLRRIPHAKEIDSHDTIIRFNSAPTKGYEDLVGTRTDIRILNHLWVTGFHGNLTWDVQVEDSTKLLRYRGSDALYKYHYSVTEHFLSSATLIDDNFMNRCSDCLTNWEAILRNTTHLADEAPQGFRSPTTGFFSISLASFFCSEINVFGFRSLPTDNYNYYGPKESYASVRGISHNFDLETAIYGYWEQHMDHFKVHD